MAKLIITKYLLNVTAVSTNLEIIYHTSVGRFLSTNYLRQKLWNCLT